jgi:hypothetical protein
MTISAFAYAQWSTQLTCFTTLTTDPREDIEITNWIINATNTQDANSNGIIFGDELNVTEITDPSNGQIIGLEIAVDPIFPGWILHLILKIHNLPSPWSVPVNVSYAISYWNETSGQWEEKTKEDLQTLFSITYTDGFYLDPDLTQLMPPNYILDVNGYVYKSEYITLDEDAPPTLEGQSIDFIVEIYAEGAGV